MKLLAIGVATAAVIGGAAAEMTEGARATAAPNPPSTQELPTAEQVTGVLTELADPGVPDQTKSTLVQGGIDAGERRAFNHARLDRAAAHGELPLSFTVGNIWPVGPQTAAAQVTISGPKMPVPVVPVLTFVDQGGWMLSSDSAAALIQTVTQD